MCLNMSTQQRCLLFLFLLFFLFGGCATRYPLGLKEEQWQASSPQQQAEYTTKQYQIDEERRIRQEEYERQKERERILQLYRNARYGDIIQVNISGGSIAFNGQRKSYEPLSFDLVRGERKRIPIYHHNRQITYQTDIWVAYDNNAFYFDVEDDPKYEHSTDKIVILDNGRWDEGKTYHPKTLDKSTYSQAQGIKVFIRYKPLPGRQRKGSYHYYPSQ